MAEKTQYFECKKCGQTCSIEYYSVWSLLTGTVWIQSAGQFLKNEYLKSNWFGDYIQCLPGGKRNTLSKEDYDKYIDNWLSTKIKLRNEIGSKYKSLIESYPIYEEELKKLEQKRKEVQEIYKNRPWCRFKKTFTTGG